MVGGDVERSPVRRREVHPGGLGGPVEVAPALQEHPGLVTGELHAPGPLAGAQPAPHPDLLQARVDVDEVEPVTGLVDFLDHVD